ncbi:MAG: PAS domain-containing protein, partial [Bacteroidota bacterium]
MSSFPIDIVWTFLIGTTALFILGASLVATLIVSHRRLRKQMKALLDSEQRFRSLVENINDIYYVCDAAGKLTYGSPNLFTTTGYREHELIGQSYVRLIASQDRRRVIDFYTTRTNDGTVDCRLEFRARLKDGSTVWVEQTARILRNPTGSVLAYQNVVHDISERKRAEQA